MAVYAGLSALTFGYYCEAKMYGSHFEGEKVTRTYSQLILEALREFATFFLIILGGGHHFAEAQTRSLDHLKPMNIRALERSFWQPKEVVAILGSDRGASWDDGYHLASSPDGKFIAQAQNNRRIIISDAADLRAISLVDVPLDKEQGFTRSITFSPDGKILAVENGFAVCLFSFSDGKAKFLNKLEDKDASVTQMAFSPELHFLACGGFDNSVRLWDLSNPKPKLTHVLKGHDAIVKCVAFSHDGKRLVSVDRDGNHLLWDLSKDKPKELSRANADSFEMVFDADRIVFAADGSVISGSTARGLCLWEDRAGSLKLLQTKKAIQFALAPDGKTLATFDEEAGKWQFWKWEGRKLSLVANLDKPSGSAGPSFAPLTLVMGGKCLIGKENLNVQIWDIVNNRLSPRIKKTGHTSEIYSLTFSPNGTILKTGSRDNTIRSWKFTGEKPIPEREVIKTESTPFSMAISPNGKFLARGDSSGIVSLQLLRTSEHWDFDVPAGLGAETSNPVGFSPDGKMLAFRSGKGNHTISLYNIETQETEHTQLPQVNGPGRDVISLAFSPDGKTLATASDEQCFLWNVQDPKSPPRVLDGVRGLVAFATRGSMLASVKADQSIALLELNRSKPTVKATLPCPDHLNSLTFSPDAKKLAASSESGFIAIWDPNTLKKLHEWKFPGAVHGISFAPDSRHLATANANGTVYVLRLDD